MFPQKRNRWLSAIRLAILADMFFVIGVDISGELPGREPSVLLAVLAAISMPAGIWLLIDFLVCVRHSRRLGWDHFFRRATIAYFTLGLRSRFLAEVLEEAERKQERLEQERVEASRSEAERRRLDLRRRASRFEPDFVQRVEALLQGGDDGAAEADRLITRAERDKPYLARADRLGVRETIASLLGSDQLDTAAAFLDGIERKNQLIAEAEKLGIGGDVRDALAYDDEAKALGLIKGQKERLRRAEQLKLLSTRIAAVSDRVDVGEARRLVVVAAKNLDASKRDFGQALYAAEKEVEAAEDRGQRARKRSSRPKTRSRETPTVD